MKVLSYILSYIRRFQRIRFSYKLFISYVLLCTIPILLTTHIFYIQAKKNTEENAMNFSSVFASQTNNTINMFMSVVDNTSKSLFTDYDIIDYLGQEESYSTFDKINKNLNIHSRLAHYSIQMPFVHGISIISSNGNIYTTGNTPDAITLGLLLDQPWYQDILNSRGQLIITPAHTHTFSVGRLLSDTEARRAGVILFHLSPQTLVAEDDVFMNISEQSRIILSTAHNQLIYDSQPTENFEENEIELILDENQYFIHSNQSDTTGLKVTVAVSKSALYESLLIYRNLSLLIAGVMLLLIAVSSILLTYQITRPIVRLTQNMTHVKEGYYEPLYVPHISKEFYTLTQTYNLMVLKIKHLIEDVYLAEIKQNESKFLALQSQINPHWLYNTLESIRMKAQLSDSPQVASMIKTLGRLFHMALSKGSTPNRVKDEISYVEAYLELQNIRYEERFKLINELPHNILQTPIIKLVFQPIIENSIIHGFLEHDQNYHIKISAFSKEGYVYIDIMDDGIGMSEQRLNTIRSMLSSTQMNIEDHSKNDDFPSIGLLNIQERIQLHYSKQCGIIINSNLGEGTQVRIKLPFEEA